ncbi:hypothetical protein [Streptomyces clavuligerus]|uniref:hypothetical protein n=1 Tax=Streptomyces clavuligerus TaxID=1901 RepID=UPI00020D920E|nr:hypothetical protein [Streptomyces clavuligerus]WDN55911.1 hypothetical protein LL058_28860 [Streptomyces clavuligerus]
MANPTTTILTAVTRRTVTVAVTEATVHTMTPNMWEALAKLKTQPLATSMAWHVGSWGHTHTVCSRLVRAGLARYETNTCLITEQGRTTLARRPASKQPATS